MLFIKQLFLYFHVIIFCCDAAYAAPSNAIYLTTK